MSMLSQLAYWSIALAVLAVVMSWTISLPKFSGIWRREKIRQYFTLFNYNFNLIELMVVMAIIGILLTILMPALQRTKETGKRIACAGNLKQGGQALAMYDSDYGRLPSVLEGNGKDAWYNRVLPYLGSSGNGTDKGFGANVMRCPVSSGLFRRSYTYGRTYGANYAGVMAYDPSCYSAWGMSGYGHGGSRLEKVPANVYVVADMSAQDWGNGDYNSRGMILNGTYGAWTFNMDFDGDGTLDSNTGQLVYQGPYNGFAPVHNNGGNLLFSDGRVQFFTRREFATNKDELFGICITMPNYP